MQDVPAPLQYAIAQFESINSEYLKSSKQDEHILAEEIMSVLRSMEIVDFKKYGRVEEASEEVTLCYLHASETTLVQVNYLAPNAFYPAHDHHGFVGVMRVLEGPLEVQTFAYADGKRPDGDMDPAVLNREKTQTYNSGDVGTILTEESHIHHIAAGPDGAVFVDVLTMYQNPGSCRFFNSTEIDPEAQSVKVDALFEMAIH